MKIAILYETYSSTTETVAGIISQTFATAGHEVVVSRMKDAMNFMEQKYDMVIFATPSWFDRGQEGQPHASFLAFMDANAQTDFTGLNAAFVGLGDSNYAHFCLAIDTLEDFFVKRGAKKVGETLKLDNFYLNTDAETDKISAWCKTILPE